MSNLLDPAILSRMEDLDLAARTVVEGFLAGRHRSPYRGYSVEFSQHRQYVHGDDTRHIDWKAYGKTERYYLKEYQQETNLRATILIDVSRSMSYRGDHLSKIDYAKLAAASLAASLAYLVLDQQDVVSVMAFNDRLTPVVAPTGRSAAFYDVCEGVLSLATGGASDTGEALRQAASLLSRRGVVVVISDFFADVPATLKGLQRLVFEGHDVLAFQVLDRDELEFPVSGLCRFEGLEG
ncbi:MAG: DUF58 domain-containing protein, partial [Planctomycetota bacterium]